MSIAAAFGLIWRSSHILPRDAFNDLCECRNIIFAHQRPRERLSALMSRKKQSELLPRGVRVAALPVACPLSANGRWLSRSGGSR